MKDIVITCQSCNQQFAWTADEQEFYQQKGLRSPVHCPICRAALKEAQKDKFRGKIKF